MRRTVVSALKLMGAVAAAVALVVLAVSHVDARWVFGVGNTLMIFGIAWYYSRGRGTNARYWASLAGMFFIHCAALATIYAKGVRIPVGYYAIWGPVEAALIYWVLIRIAE